MIEKRLNINVKVFRFFISSFCFKQICVIAAILNEWCATKIFESFPKREENHILHRPHVLNYNCEQTTTIVLTTRVL